MVPSIDRALVPTRIGTPAAGPCSVTSGGWRRARAPSSFRLSCAASLTSVSRLECVGKSLWTGDAARARRRSRASRSSSAGELRAAEVAARMRGWSALVLPSYTEGMPLVALEALSSGIPVVAVDGRAAAHARDRAEACGSGAAGTPRRPDRARPRVPPDARRGLDPRPRAGGRSWDAVSTLLPAWRPRPEAVRAAAARSPQAGSGCRDGGPRSPSRAAPASVGWRR